MKGKYYILYDVLNDYSAERVSGKSEYGSFEHAKKRAVKDNRGSSLKWHVDSRYRFQGKPAKAWKGFNKHDELINLIVEVDKTKGNPVAKKTKKKRSAKQLANDKRLGKMAKARAQKKRAKNPCGSKRKTNPKRKSLKKDHLWLIFKCHGNSVAFASAVGTKHGRNRWTSKKGEAMLFTTKGVAEKGAKMIARERGMAKYHVGAASRSTTGAQILAACNPKR